MVSLEHHRLGGGCAFAFDVAQHAAQTRILTFKPLDPRHLAHAQFSVSGQPAVIGRSRQAFGAKGILNGLAPVHSSTNLLQARSNLSDGPVLPFHRVRPRRQSDRACGGSHCRNITPRLQIPNLSPKKGIPPRQQSASCLTGRSSPHLPSAPRSMLWAGASPLCRDAPRPDGHASAVACRRVMWMARRV